MGDASQNEQPGRGQFADDVTVHSDIGTGGSLDDDAHGLLVVDHLGAAIARVKWNGTYGPSDCTC